MRLAAGFQGLPTPHQSAMTGGVNVLQSVTSPAWLPVALKDFDAVLLDHAHCEKKAAASAMALVAAYPEHHNLVRRCVGLAQEELRHFRQVHRIIMARGLTLPRDPGDPYARALLTQVRSGFQERRIDRLLISSLIEARSCERLALLADGLEDPELKKFYAALAQAEAGHHTLFVQLAEEFAPVEVVQARLTQLAAYEATVVASLPVEARIH